ncbi:ubiquinone/menaquinone biosynthesis C-methylase UbiE [Geothermobacter ehrlichii]|uniref:Ubiquinone/menaquinone biosynthesis C-methylase UbiE n=1 Tax=Geothermobacter ehrlichii TaxID=213224 RepID=A0A5D3WLX1_9BACT|nr:class I SAM-dependent methyltransferase [Geothermobacter ehrlichii]TYO99017.1 ubiquinone/menaquinone biosynthesis C-methylase UbiE [Geothermobacter ehrlichii]
MCTRPGRLQNSYRRLFAAVYDRAMASAERRCLGAWRRELLEQAQGAVLEIGSGTGSNLPHYPPGLTRLVLGEPDPFMCQQLQKKLTAAPLPAVICTHGAEQLPFPAASFDTVVSTLVLCSVDSPQAALEEIRRVLRPGGCLLFLEHVLSDQPATRRWQRFWEPLWKQVACNCHLTRDTAATIRSGGFVLEQLDELQIAGAPAILRRVLRGMAVKCGWKILSPDTLLRGEVTKHGNFTCI